MALTLIVDTLADLVAFANKLVGSADIEAKLDQLISMASETQTQETALAADLSQLMTDVANDTTVDQSAITLIQGLAGNLATAIAALPDPTQLQSLQSQLETNAQGLAAAVAANTPAAPPPGP